jgi:hypothetical protein
MLETWNKTKCDSLPVPSVKFNMGVIHHSAHNVSGFKFLPHPSQNGLQSQLSLTSDGPQTCYNFMLPQIEDNTAISTSWTPPAFPTQILFMKK